MYIFQKKYDVIVVGAGHAGCEASLAASRMGCRVLLLTGNLDTIAQMSCNPAIGGLAKGHIVREIDALGGDMAMNIDRTGIQFRMLNTKKGPAVRASRAQADKRRYQEGMKERLEEQKNIDLAQERVIGIDAEGGRAGAVLCDSATVYRGDAVIITTGTFLEGVIHIGETSFPAGRAGEPASVKLGQSLRSLGFEMGRLKTGTPPRVNLRTLDLTKTDRQEGDEPPMPFSFRTSFITIDQVPCYITHTNKETRGIILKNLDRSPLYGGRIKAAGARYCPSVEDKMVRFPDRERHQVFIEPEGRHTKEAYLNGLSTSLPFDVQIRMVRSVPGLKNAAIMRPGYAIEYSYANPTQLRATLETKMVKGLYFAGQINGTSGYEEAAAQGLMAGINAALKVQGREALVLDRAEAYIGVLIDDLVTKGTREPYRMFTSRAEYRLHLRQDNADLRLAHYGHELGLVGDSRMEKIRRKRRDIDEARAALGKVRSGGASGWELLRRPGVRYGDLLRGGMPGLREYGAEVVEQVEIEAKYAGYLERQKEEIERFKAMEGRRIPQGVDYRSMRGLKKEAVEKLDAIRPTSLGQASRIAGITPADISVLMVWLERARRKKCGRLLQKNNV